MTDILAIGAHPDDIEFGCGGILAAEAARGCSIVMVDLTLGECATHGTPEIRKEESKRAASLIGAKRFFLDFADCEIADNYLSRQKLVRVIREIKPRLVIAPIWCGEQNHPDHLACGLIARYSCMMARFGKVLPELPTHRVEGILHYPSRNCDQMDFLFDISGHVTVWQQMIACHASQLKTIDYQELNLRHAARLGSLIDRPYAQGLVKGNPIVIDELMAISKGARDF